MCHVYTLYTYRYNYGKYYVIGIFVKIHLYIIYIYSYYIYILIFIASFILAFCSASDCPLEYLLGNQEDCGTGER